MNRVTTFTIAFCIVGCMLLSGSSAHAQRGARVAPRTLDQLTREADTIIHGSVISARVEPHPQFSNLMTVVVSLHVNETLKGSAGKTLQFRQYIWDLRDRLDAAGYQKGAELLLMLGPVSPYGLRSPVGLEQGRFVISHDNAGHTVARNGVANVGLFANSESQVQNLQKQGVKLSARTAGLMRQKTAGPLALSDLEEAIRSFGGAR